MEINEKQPNFISQVATIVNFFTAIIQLVIILITINFYNSTQKYAERQYMMLEKIIEKHQSVNSSNEQILLKVESLATRLDNFFKLTRNQE